MDFNDEDYHDDEDYCGGDEDQNVEFDDDRNPPTEDASRSCNGSSCKVITKESLLAAQREDLERVMDLLSVKEHHARTLLKHYRWDVDKVCDVFVNKGKETLFAEACVMVRDDGNILSSEALCENCKKEVPAYKMTTMDCSHCFCNICWTNHFVVMINEGESKRISCMASKCLAVCDEELIRTLVSEKNPDVAEKFDRFLLESYIEDNRRVKWCPSVPHCGNAIRIEDGDEYREVECACGVQFCFSCSSEAHSPCSCRMWELWIEKCKRSFLPISGMRDDIKPCPKCLREVMESRWDTAFCMCGEASCWICGETAGADHTCGRSGEELATNSELFDLRFTRYYNHFETHRDSTDAEITMKELQKKILETEASVDCSWVIDGADRFFRSRRVLSYSYPFAYYVFYEDLLCNEMTINDKETKQKLFEDRQHQLWGYLEKFSFLLTQPFHCYSREPLMELKMQTLTLSSLVDDLCKKLYEFIDNELLLQHHLGTKTHIIAPYRSKGPEKAVEFGH